MSGNNLPFYERPDLSPYLIHLTKGSEDCSALDNLKKILATGRINGSTRETGYIKGDDRAACFMDIPLGSLKYIITDENSNPPRYEPYGILLQKTWAFERGCRPVLYLSDAETKELNIRRDELWRVVRFEGVNGRRINWVHEREWRCKGDFRLPSRFLAVLVKDVNTAADLLEEIYCKKPKWKATPRTVLPLSVVCQGLIHLTED